MAVLVSSGISTQSNWSRRETVSAASNGSDSVVMVVGGTGSGRRRLTYCESMFADGLAGRHKSIRVSFLVVSGATAVRKLPRPLTSQPARP